MTSSNNTNAATLTAINGGGATVHPIRERLTAQARARSFTLKETVDGVEFELRTPMNHDDDWVVARTSGTNGIGFFLGQTKPRIARTLVSIGGEPIETLYPIPVDMPAARREKLLTDSKELRDWRAEVILTEIVESWDDVTVAGIREKIILPMDKRREAVAAGQSPLSPRTPSST